MKRIVISLLALTVLMACNNKKEEKNLASQNTIDSLTDVVNQKNNELNDIMSTFNDIQEGFREINEAEGRVNIARNNGETNAKADIMENISFIKRTMQLNKERIAKLREQLKESSFNTSKLQATIESLNKELESKTARIEELQAELDSKNAHIAHQDKQISELNTNVNSLTADNAAKARAVEQQDKQLNTAWYVFGTKKELREQHILEGTNKVLKGNNFNKDYFTKIDIRVDKVIKLYSKSAKLLTNHPAGSYSLDKDARGMYTLRITNPTTFWSVSKYLVVVVK
ncbi:MAG: hypothetical protein DBY24_10200 [Prevotellaceae bacterium]|jgi:lipoprotein|nr:hypothetical protein [Prevotellaceae bacterium]PWL76247.1 MAG: hypothetical protein DBY24_10200 [Prevotellaceae bacterium]